MLLIGARGGGPRGMLTFLILVTSGLCICCSNPLGGGATGGGFKTFADTAGGPGGFFKPFAPLAPTPITGGPRGGGPLGPTPFAAGGALGDGAPGGGALGEPRGPAR